MKINKTIMAALLGLGVASIADAGTVYLSGSTAFRSSTYATLTNVTSGVFASAPAVTTWKESTGPSDATYMAFTGTLVGGSGSTTINCLWSGSEAGIADVATNRVENFLSSLAIDGASHGSTVPTGTQLATGVSDVAMADNAQANSLTTTPTVTSATKVGIIPFKWVRNNGVWTGANVTDSQIRKAISGGVKLAVFTGNAADTANYVYVSGRDNQSGTRVNALGLSGFGIKGNVIQINIDSAAGTMLATAPVVNGGQSSGGTLAKTLGVSTVGKADIKHATATGGYSAIAYLGYADAAVALGLGATELTYNGVAESTANIQEGTYNFWGNEFVMENNGSLANAEANTVYAQLAANIPANCNNIDAISLTSMHCTRASAVADPSHN